MSGVLCDRRMDVKIKGTAYRTVVRLVYGADTLALKKGECYDGCAELQRLPV